MLTLRELKNMVENPPHGQKLPTAKKLRLSEKPIVEQEIGADGWISAYKSGYAIYRAGGVATVFRIHSCSGYCYGFMENMDDIDGGLFEDAPWYLRLVLEGEDRLCHNCETKAQKWNVSYSAVSEEWGEMDSGMEPVLERLIWEETIDTLLSVLSERQRRASVMFYLEQRTKREIAAELGVTAPAVTRMIAKSTERMRDSLRTSAKSGRRSA